MNERIKELLAQAHLDVMEDLGNIDTNQVAEKFAELIVQECIEVARVTDPSDGDDYRSGRYWAGLDIKKHFGVEE